jgi:hypothetical protein
LPGFGEHVIGDVGVLVGWLTAAGVALVLAWLWWRMGPDSAWLRYGAAAAGLVLVVPQALFYEAGLLVLPLALLWELHPGRHRWVVLLWASAWLQLLNGSLDLSPLLITVLATFVWFVSAIWHGVAPYPGAERTTSV